MLLLAIISACTSLSLHSLQVILLPYKCADRNYTVYMHCTQTTSSVLLYTILYGWQVMQVSKFSLSSRH